MSDEETPWEIQIPPGLQIDIQEHWLPIASLREKLIKLTRDHRLLTLDMESARIRFWNMLEQNFPEISSPCHFDAKSMSIKSGVDPKTIKKND